MTTATRITTRKSSYCFHLSFLLIFVTFLNLSLINNTYSTSNYTTFINAANLTQLISSNENDIRLYFCCSSINDNIAIQIGN